MEKRKITGEAVRFVIVGIAATGLHYLIYLGLVNCMPANPAYALGYIISFIGNFYATSYFTFHATPSWKRLAGMAGAHGINFLVHMGLFNLFLWAGVPEWLVPVPVYAIAVPLNFVLVRFVFKK